ncbi:cytochrome P450 [Astrocystis sublimbata]|nr:cytochrome P450 [Astrocystis sublimbata]
MFAATIACAGAALLLHLAALLSYRLLLHPLRAYPGPLLAKLTDGYAGVHALAQRLHLITYQDHQNYGSVVRHAPNRLVFNTITAYRDIYKGDNTTKSDVYQATQQSKDVFSILNVRDSALHRLKRKLIGRAVSDQSMKSFQPTMLQEIDIFIRRIHQTTRLPDPQQSVNVAQYFKHLGYDVVGHLAFGYPLRLQTDPENRFVAEANAYGNYRMNVYMQWPLLRHVKIERLFDLMSNSLRARLLSLIEKMIKTRLAQTRDARRDLYYHVADEFSTDATGVRLGNLWSEAVFFIPAGLRRHHIHGSIRSGPQLASCRYLRAAIDEALRMSPPLPGTLWRERAADTGGPWIIDGHVVPPGTKVGVNTYALHHNEAYFPEPFSFVPERWLEDSTPFPQASHRDMQDAFAAFSTGPRGCAGKAMAYLEASLVVARTLWYFDFEAAPGGSGTLGAGRSSGAAQGRRMSTEYQLYDVFISIHDGPNLVFSPRGDFCRDLDSE